MRRGRGTQFDPVCADAFIGAWRKGKIDRILQDYYLKDEKSIACPFCSTHIRLPEGAKIEDEFECEVCHRQIKLQTKNDAFYGELMPQSNVLHLKGSPRFEGRHRDDSPPIRHAQRQTEDLTEDTQTPCSIQFGIFDRHSR